MRNEKIKLSQLGQTKKKSCVELMRNWPKLWSNASSSWNFDQLVNSHFCLTVVAT